MEEQLFKQKIPIEEKRYMDAVGLQESVDWITCFERKVIALNNAALKFEKLGGYKDSAERVVACKNLAKEIEVEGCKAAFAIAKKKQAEAKSKSDFLDAINEYKRVWKKEEYEKEAAGHIDECRKGILNLEKKAVWKRRIITLAVLVIGIFIFSKTIAFPFVKGIIHQQLGNYQAAVANYKLSINMPSAEGKLKTCYYHLGNEQLEKGNKEKAFRLFVKAESHEDATAKVAALEKEFLQSAKEGQKVTFGTEKWYVLDKRKDSVLLLSAKNKKKMLYSNEANTAWEDTNIYTWLNDSFLKQTFSEEERAMIFNPKDMGLKETKENGSPFLLSSEEYKKYASFLSMKKSNWWLRDDAGLSAMRAEYVNLTGEVKKTFINNTSCFIRPAVWITFD